MVGIAGLTVAHFWISLTLLGVGWNFAFIGATTMVDAHATARRSATKVQSFNDFLIFGIMALGSFASGKILATYGWIAVNGACFRRSLRLGAAALADDARAAAGGRLAGGAPLELAFELALALGARSLST